MYSNYEQQSINTYLSINCYNYVLVTNEQTDTTGIQDILNICLETSKTFKIKYPRGLTKSWVVSKHSPNIL